VRPGEEYFNSVYEQTYTRVLNYVLARLSGSGAYHDVCDVLQEVYADFYRTLRRKGEGYIKCDIALLFKIADSRLRIKYRQRKSLAEAVSLSDTSRRDGEEPQLADEDSDGEDQIIDRLLAEEIMDIVKSGDEESAQIFLLRYERDMKLDEIARVLGLEPYTVKNKLYRKLIELKKIFNMEV